MANTNRISMLYHASPSSDSTANSGSLCLTTNGLTLIRDEDGYFNQNQATMWPKCAKKRVSPDTETIRALSSPSSQRQSKRAKVEAFQFLGRGQEYSEYHKPLRDPDLRTPVRAKGHKRALSTKQTSPSKTLTSIFPLRAQSVPLGVEDEVRMIDFTSIPPSPCRSPTKGVVEIRRAPSVSPPSREQMDVDVDDTSALLHFTNPTHITTPRANPVFRYTVNFATPRESNPPRSGFPSASPLSPLTPLPASPPTEYLPQIQSLLAKKGNAKLLAFRDGQGKDVYTDSPGSLVIPLMADTTRDVFQPLAHIPDRPSSAASTSCLASVVSGSSATFQPRPPRSPVTLASSIRLVSPEDPQKKNDSERTVTLAGDSGQPKDASSNNSDSAGRASTAAYVGLSSGPGSRLDSNAIPTTRPSIIGAVKHKRGPSVQQGPKRVTRSVSMKEQRVKVGPAEIEDYTPEVPVTSTNTVAGPSSAVESKPRPLKSTGAVTPKSRPPLIAKRSASVSKLPSDSSKLKQTSLTTFAKAKPSTTGTATIGNSAASTSTGTGGPSRVASTSPSKIPLFTSPFKRPSTSQSGSAKPFVFSLGSTGTGGTGTSRATSGRSLATLSHALDKLAAPPPSRPNTSLGFVRGEGASGEDSSPENDNKGKGKAKDDTSLPTASTIQGTRASFARPTAASLKRAATATGFGSAAAAAAARMQGRGAAVVGGSGRGRGVRGIFGKAGDRASKKTSLPVVMGSPVKGSRATGDFDRDDDDLGGDKHTPRLGSGSERGAGGFTGEDVFMSQDTATDDSPEQDSVMQDVLAPPPNASNGVEIDLTTSPISADKGKQRAVSSSTLNPASSALHALSQSLSSLPQTPTPPKPRVVGTRSGLRSSSAAVGKESPALGGTGASGKSEVHWSGGAGPNGGTVNGLGGVKTSTLKILKQCAIFVDVRTEQGDDAGSLFIDMLKGLGAKIMSRLGSRCTHIVYKNGHPHTLTRYRLLNDPKPVVIGIAWVVECVEKRARVDEERFKIDVDFINVAGAHLKRRSLLPKHLIPVSLEPDYEIPIHVSSEADEDDGVGGIDGSLSQDPDLSMRSREEDDLPPLERARRRRSILPGGQTRLFP